MQQPLLFGTNPFHRSATSSIKPLHRKEQILTSKIMAALLASTAILTATPALAHKNGAYAGIVLGGSYTDFDLEAHLLGGGQLDDQQYLAAFEYGANIGYHYNLPRDFFLEVEGEILFATGSEGGFFGVDLEASKEYSYAFYVKPGYQIDEKWGAFLVAGAQWISYEAKFAPGGFKESDKSGGFIWGLGVNYSFNESVSLSAEYNRVQPLDVTYVYDPATVSDSRFDPELDIVKVALKYHF